MINLATVRIVLHEYEHVSNIQDGDFLEFCVSNGEHMGTLAARIMDMNVLFDNKEIQPFEVIFLLRIISRFLYSPNFNQDEFEKLINKLNNIFETTDVNQLAQKLSETIKIGNAKGANGFFWLMIALNLAANRRSEKVVSEIAKIASVVIEKIDSKTLLQGLSQEKDNEGSSGFYWLTQSLWITLQNAPYHLLVSAPHQDLIIGVVKKILEQPTSLTNNSHISCFFRNTIPWLLKSDKLFDCLAEIKASSVPKENLQILLNMKDGLKAELVRYIKTKPYSSVDEFEKATCADTLLGKLIDHRKFFWGTSQTREEANKRKQELTQQAAKGTTQRTEQHPEEQISAATRGILLTYAEEARLNRRAKPGQVIGEPEPTGYLQTSKSPPSYDESQKNEKELLANKLNSNDFAFISDSEKEALLQKNLRFFTLQCDITEKTARLKKTTEISPQADSEKIKNAYTSLMLEISKIQSLRKAGHLTETEIQDFISFVGSVALPVVRIARTLTNVNAVESTAQPTQTTQPVGNPWVDESQRPYSEADQHNFDALTGSGVFATANQQARQLQEVVVPNGAIKPDQDSQENTSSCVAFKYDAQAM